MPLSGRKILVAKDEYLIADDLAVLLRRAGAEVIGPASSLPKAMRLAGDTQQFDAAVLDINLRGVNIFPLADELRARGIPMLFMTGCGVNNVPADYRTIARFEKPTGAARVVEELDLLLRKEPAGA